MRVFKDGSGRDWTMAVNYTVKQRVLAETGADLFDLRVFEKLGDDTTLLLEVVCSAVKDQLEAKKITPQQFLDSLTGDSIEAAANALTEEIIAFFPQRRREVLKKLQAAGDSIQQKAVEEIDRKLASGELQRKLEATLRLQSGDSPASAESTQDSSPSAS